MARKVFIIIILIALFIPLVKRYNGVPVNDYQLNGAVEPVAKPSFSLHSFAEGDFQDKTTSYLQDSVGYKGFLIALKNQVDYSLFNALHYGVESGKDGQLFGWDNIANHLGPLSITEDSLQKKVRQCIELKTLLDSLHIATLFVFAASKPNVYPDKLPDKYKSLSSANNDYHHILSALNANNLPVIDYNAWFKSIRPSSAHPLFPKLGTHWSYYGACLVMDSLSKYIEKELKISLPGLKLDSVRVTDKPAYKNERDLGSLLNLLISMRSDSLAYPSYSVNYNRQLHKKPKILFIGDSFVWTLLDTKLPAQLFSPESRYWFYKHDLHYINGTWITNNPDDVNLKELLQGTDMVIFVSTEVLNHRFDFELLHAIRKDQSLAAAQKNK